MIAKIDNCKIKHQPNTEKFFETAITSQKIKLIMKLNTINPISKDKIKILIKKES